SANSSATFGTPSFGSPLLRLRLPPELFLNRLGHEVHDGDVVRDAVHLEAALKVFGDAGRQLRQGLFGSCHLCRLLLPARAPVSDGEGTTRRVRRLHEPEAVGYGDRRALPEPPAHEAREEEPHERAERNKSTPAPRKTERQQGLKFEREANFE